MNTREVIKNMQLVGGGLALLSAAGLTYAITKSINSRKKYARPFDSNTIEEFEGKILEVAHTEDKKDETRGIYLSFEVEEEIIPVHLGPAWYINHQGRRFKPGDKITVKGSRIQFDGTEAIVAVSVSRNDEILKLRNEDGTPYWYGWSKAS